MAHITMDVTDIEEVARRRRQVGGDHYTKLVVQPLDVMRATFTQEEFQGFLRGNVIKYVMRDKGDRLEYLKKAKHYLDTLISEIEARPTLAKKSRNDDLP